MKAIKVDNIWEEVEHLPGSFQFENSSSLLYVCPCGCKTLRSLPLKSEANSRGWNFDGNFEQPTITPSIKIVGKCEWHGFLTNGEWITCGS